MARIAFFTERLPPHDDPIASFAYGLMYTLAEQDHEVQVHATYRPGDSLPSTHPRLRILRPFQKWNWLEIPRLIPLLLEFRPQVLHIIEPHARSVHGWTNAMSALPSLKPLLARPKIVTTFYDLKVEQLKRHRLLLQGSDLVTVTNRSQADLLATVLPRAQIEILPVPTFHDRGMNAAGHELIVRVADPAEHLRAFLEKQNEFVFIPGDLDQHLSLKDLAFELSELMKDRGELSFLFGGGWGSILPPTRRKIMAVFEEAGVGARVFISGPLSESAEMICLQSARLVFLASLKPESLSLTRLLLAALNTSTVPVMSQTQVELDARPWRHREHAWISGESPLLWRTTLREAIDSPGANERMKLALPDFARLQTLDLPGNVMSRLYSRLLETV